MQPTRLLPLLFLLPDLSAQVVSWQQATTPVSPPARRGAAMAYNPATQRCVLFGGAGISNRFGDTWVWNGSTWLDASPAVSPPPRYLSGLAYDETGLRMILFGGSGSTGVLGDTWSWNGAQWTQLAPANAPSPREGMSLAYDPLRQVIVGFGGATGGMSSSTDETYEFDGTDWHLRPSMQVPPQRHSAHLYFHEARGRIQMHGGLAASGTVVLNDIWEWDGLTWTDVTPMVSAPVRRAAAVAYDGSSQQMVRFGGQLPLVVTHDDQWFWDTQWHADDPNTVRPPGRYAASMTFDEARQQLVVFGGFTDFPGVLVPNQTWVSAFGHLARAIPYGNSCSTAVFSSSRPLLGQGASVFLVVPPSQFAFVAIGWNNATFNGQPLPVDLSGIGMTGCSLLTSADVVGLPMSQGPVLTRTESLPNTATLLGASAYVQAFALAPGANPLQFVSTRGIEWVLGDI